MGKRGSEQPARSIDAIVLVAGSDKSNLDKLRTLLQDDHTIVIGVDSDQSALSAAHREAPDIVLIDLPRQGGGAVELCRTLKAESGLRDVPVVLVTSGSHENRMIIKGLEAGADDYMDASALPALFRGKVKRLAAEGRDRRARVEAEARYRSLLEFLPAIVYVAEAEAPYYPIYLSPEAESLGYSLEEWHRRPDLWISLLHPEDRKTMLGLDDPSLAPARRNEYEYRLIARDGSVRWFHDSGRFVKDETNRIICWQGVMVDITERKRAEEALRRSDVQYRDLVEHSQDLICTHDLEGRLLSLNEGAARQLGYAPEALISRKISEGLPPELRVQFDAYLEEIKSKGIACGIMKVQTATGETRLWEYRNTLKTDGVPAPIVRGMAHDITERSRAEKALRRSEERYREIFEYGFVAIFVFTPDGRILVCNGAFAEVFGFGSVEEALQCNVASLFVDLEARDLMLEELRVRKGLRNYEVELRSREGKPLHLIANLIGKFDKRGDLAEIHSHMFDNTNRKLLEEQLRQSQKMDAIGRLAGGVAHDFNNLLTAIIGYSQLLESRLDPESPMLRELGQIRKAGERAASLTRQLLAFSRRQMLQPRVLDMNTTIAETSKLLRRLISENIELITKLEPNLWKVKADPGQIEQVIINLVVNARDAMPEGGKLIIETANAKFNRPPVGDQPAGEAGPYVMLAISDTGCGMDIETRTHVFEPFFTTKPLGEGSGLGMSTVYGIIKQSGGEVVLYSEPDVGTTFKIYLPKVEEAEEESSSPFLSSASYRGNETILLVEDEESVRSLARDVLKTSGYNVLEAPTVEEALLIGDRADRIHLMLTDVVMPQMGGRELARMLVRVRPDLKVVYMSGYTENAIVRGGILDAQIAFVQKPFIPTDLLRKIREVLDSGPRD
ncbi:MAG TPA: PAS domain S-box protein [Blastocatellia bacterium]|nr:PAS domain S-box protein [Blastocatellia bacterium]